MFQGLRIPSRMTIMIGLSLAVLAGYGVRRVLAGVRSRGARAAVTATLIAVVMIDESWSAPLPCSISPANSPRPTRTCWQTRVSQTARLPRHRWLRDRAPDVIVEFPINQA